MSDNLVKQLIDFVSKNMPSSYTINKLNRNGKKCFILLLDSGIIKINEKENSKIGGS